MVSHCGVSSCHQHFQYIRANFKSVLGGCIPHSKRAVLSISLIFTPILKVNTKFGITSIGQPLYKLTSKPEFIREVTRAISVIDQVPVKVFTTIFSLFETFCNGISHSIQLGLININISHYFMLAVMTNDYSNRTDTCM